MKVRRTKSTVRKWKREHRYRISMKRYHGTTKEEIRKIIGTNKGRKCDFIKEPSEIEIVKYTLTGRQTKTQGEKARKYKVNTK